MDKINPLVTVIVTTYNRKELLKKTINSILNQTYKNFEFIIIDNFSNYNFFSYIKSFNDSRINAYQNNNNGIIAINRNYAIKQSKGELIAFCDDDDIWHRTKLEKTINIFHSKTRVDIVSHAVYRTLNGEIISKWPRPISYSKANIYSQLLLRGNFVGLCTVVIKKKIMEELNGFNESKGYLAVEDYDLWLRIAKSGKIFKYISEPLAESRIGGMSTENATVQYKNLLRVIKKHYLVYHPKTIKVRIYYYFRLFKILMKILFAKN